MKLASIDIGTNTLRLLIGSVDGCGHISDSLLKREITRLGGGFDGRRLHPDSRARTLKALHGFSKVIRKSGVSSVRAAATSVVRKAEDGGEFITEILEKTGIEVDMIDGDTEASLTLKGVLSSLEGREKRALVFDIGGGSTEYIVADNGEVKGLVSLNMGVVSLTERHLKSDPPSKDDIMVIEAAVDRFIDRIKNGGTRLKGLELISPESGGILVGTAGTITTLAALDQELEVYDTRKINNYVLTRMSVSRLFDRLARMTHRERAAMAALEEGRADLIIAGAIIVLRTMEEFGFGEMVVSDYGLLEGLLLDLAERKGALR